MNQKAHHQRHGRTFGPSGTHPCDARSVQSRYIFVVAGLLVVVGLVLIPLPGPGLLIVTLGLLVLVAGLVVSTASWLSHRRGSSPTR